MFMEIFFVVLFAFSVQEPLGSPSTPYMYRRRVYKRLSTVRVHHPEDAQNNA